MLKIKIKHSFFSFLSCELDGCPIKKKRVSPFTTVFFSKKDCNQETHTLSLKQGAIYSSKIAYLGILNPFVFLRLFKRGVPLNYDSDYLAADYSFKSEKSDKCELEFNLYNDERFGEHGTLVASCKNIRITRNDGLKILNERLKSMPENAIKRWRRTHIFSSLLYTVLIFAILTAEVIKSGFKWRIPILAVVVLLICVSNVCSAAKTIGFNEIEGI